MEAEAQAEATAETPSGAETQTTMPPLTATRATDITLGLGKSAVDFIDKAAQKLDDTVRHIREDAPGFLNEMEEKGRPVREKLAESIKGFNITDVFNKVTKPGDSPASDPTAFDDIEALENRVRELEQQVSSEPVAETAPAATPVASPFSMLELDDEPPAAPAPVETVAEAEAEAEPEAPAETPEPAAKKPAARRTKKKPEGEASAE